MLQLLLILLALVPRGLQGEMRPEPLPMPPTVFIAPADGSDDCWESRLIREALSEGRSLTVHPYCTMARSLAGDVGVPIFLDLRRQP
jgi:hypothetical protein